MLRVMSYTQLPKVQQSDWMYQSVLLVHPRGCSISQPECNQSESDRPSCLSDICTATCCRSAPGTCSG
jgi:hypothetical protein